ncbi:MAG: 2-succinyl-5-enolpyruvyl-6-hydroxy-3-cyclohexene-1-carboxylic-acid synthase [Marmoricola sp.]
MTSTDLARALVDLLVEAGVEHVVVCPGSRSAPLAFASYDAARDGRVTLHTRIDERTAGFLALGIAKSSRRLTVVLCTSGTATANLHPAVLEAAHAGVPLVAVTADRPASLRGTGANQTTDQVGLYGDAAVSFDIASEEDLTHVRFGAGPVHLNVQLTEPLVPPPATVISTQQPSRNPVYAGVGSETGTRASSSASAGTTDPPRRRWAAAEDAVRLASGPRTVVVAGDGAGPPARGLAERTGWPLFAEPSSGSRTGDSVIRGYRLLLDSDLGEQIQRVVVCGHPTLSRPVTRLLARDIEVVSVPPRGRWVGRPHPVSQEAAAFDADPDDPSWFAAWKARDLEVTRRLDALVEAEELGPHAVAREVSAAVPPGGQLYVGASNPIRDLDLMAAHYEVGARRKVLANRGLSGIDGTLSSAIGAALTRPGARNLALVGDVTFLHDMTALVIGPDEPRPDLTIVVVNDDGGSIFASLEQGGPSYAEPFERIFGTPHGVDLASLCAATHTPHWRVESVPELRQALATPNGGIEVVEVRCRRDNRRALDEAIRNLAVDQ